MSPRKRTSNFTEGAGDRYEVDPSAAPGEAAVQGEMFHAYPSEPTQPGFVMSDKPLDVPSQNDPAMPGPAAITPNPFRPDVLDGEIIPPNGLPNAFGEVDAISRSQASGIRYEGRIRILDAFQYTGNLASAPEWVDRNWIAYGDHDPLRSIEPGPMLRVPLPSGHFAHCRVGDYVAIQEVRLTANTPGDQRIEVWAKEDFRKNFLPVGQEEFA